MYIIDAHCDSIGCAPPLVKGHNFSKKYPHLQVVALFDTDGAKTENYIATYKKCVKDEKLCAVTTFTDIKNAFEKSQNAVLLSIEGGTVLETHSLEHFYNEGVRIVGLAWYSNALAKSNRLQKGELDTGLTDLGRETVKKGNDLGIIFDVSHLSDNSFWELAELSKKPIAATHSNFRALCSHSRNLTDAMAREIIKQGGVIGLNLYPDFVGKNRSVGALFEHIDHCLSLGGEDCLGFGFDIDGTDGQYVCPLDETESIHDKITELMLSHGYKTDLIEKIAYKNFLNFFQKYI